MRTNTTRQRALAGETTIGTMCNLSSPLGAETLGNCGYDFIVIDLQHGENGIDGVQFMLQAMSATPTIPVVRVTANSAIQIQRVLDLGAYGVIVPFINNRQQAEEIIQNAFYPPLGSRSWGPTRAMMYAGSDYFSGSSGELLALPMLESSEGLANAQSILEVDGISGCFVGPSDLNISLGYTPDGPLSEETERGIAEILAITKHLGKIAGIHAVSVEDAKRRSKQGFKFITVAADTRLLRLGAQQTLTSLRA